MVNLPFVKKMVDWEKTEFRCRAIVKALFYFELSTILFSTCLYLNAFFTKGQALSPFLSVHKKRGGEKLIAFPRPLPVK